MYITTCSPLLLVWAERDVALSHCCGVGNFIFLSYYELSVMWTFFYVQMQIQNSCSTSFTVETEDRWSFRFLLKDAVEWENFGSVGSWFHGLSVLQPQNFSRYHTYPLTSVGAPSARALLQHGIQFLLPLETVPPYTASSVTSSLTS